MADEPEVIKEQMAETRVSLGDKIEKLEDTLLGTVKDTLSTATHTVENVSESVEHTVETVKESVEESVEAVKEAFNLRSHVERHPWAMMAGAVAVGFLGGRLVSGAQHRRRRRRERHEVESFPRNGAMPGAIPARAEPRPTEEPEHTEEEPSLLDQFGETFGDEIAKLKSLALGVTFGMLRDMVAGSAPAQLRSQLADVFNGLTTKLGGKPIEQPLFESDNEESATRGGHNGKRHETEMGRPVGSTPGTCETVVGRSDRRRAVGR